MKHVLIMYRFLPQYRVDFYIRLKDILIKNDIKLNLVYGKSKNEDALKKDEVDIEWAQYIPYKQIKIRDIVLVWQPYLKQLKNKENQFDRIITKLQHNWNYPSPHHVNNWLHNRYLEKRNS